MNQLAPAPAETGAESFVRRYQGLRDRLPGDRALREAACATFRRLGLPTRRDEAWHYTSLQRLGEAGYQEPLSIVDSAPSLGALPDLPRLVLVDGRLQTDLCTWPAGVRVSRFADAPDLTIDEALPMVALNAMLVEDGAVIEVPDGLDAGAMVLLCLAPDAHRPVDIHPRHRITLGAGARLTLIEIHRGEGAYLTNLVGVISLAEGACLTHVRLQQEAAGAAHVATSLATLGAGAEYDAFVLAQGAGLARTEMHITLAGPGASARLNAVQMLGARQHGDITTVIRHAAPGCASRQTVKSVLSGRARGVFQGRIEVARAAQKTDGYQMNQALLLSPEAEMDSKPQLEIYADDVKCSHGATVGELDADQLFYLRSRGLDAEEARAVLVRAFLAEALEPVTEPAARTLLDQALAGWWEGQAA